MKLPSYKIPKVKVPAMMGDPTVARGVRQMDAIAGGVRPGGSPPISPIPNPAAMSGSGMRKGGKVKAGTKSPAKSKKGK